MCEIIRVIFGYIWVLYKFVFQIDWLGNRRNDICGSGRLSGVPCGSSLVDVCELLIGVLISIVPYK